MQKAEAEAARARAAVDGAAEALDARRPRPSTAAEEAQEAAAGRRPQATEAALAAAEAARGRDAGPRGRGAGGAVRGRGRGQCAAGRSGGAGPAGGARSAGGRAGAGPADGRRRATRRRWARRWPMTCARPKWRATARSGWAALPDYDVTAGPARRASQPLAAHVAVPGGAARGGWRRSGWSPRDRAPRLQAALRPGQRLVSVEGDLWRWDGFRAGAEDAPSAAALRLQQLNRLVAAEARPGGGRRPGPTARGRRMRRCRRGWPTWPRADQLARDARRAADRR